MKSLCRTRSHMGERADSMRGAASRCGSPLASPITIGVGTSITQQVLADISAAWSVSSTPSARTASMESCQSSGTRQSASFATRSPAASWCELGRGVPWGIPPGVSCRPPAMVGPPTPFRPSCCTASRRKSGSEAWVVLPRKMLFVNALCPSRRSAREDSDPWPPARVRQMRSIAPKLTPNETKKRTKGRFRATSRPQVASGQRLPASRTTKSAAIDCVPCGAGGLTLLAVIDAYPPAQSGGGRAKKAPLRHIHRAAALCCQRALNRRRPLSRRRKGSERVCGWIRFNATVGTVAAAPRACVLSR